MKKSNKKSIEETYVKKTQHEHILDLPDTYIGSVEESENECYIMDENNMIIKKNILLIPGLYKIFDEIIVNAIDQWTRLSLKEECEHRVTIIKVNIDKKNNEISVYNNGEGLPIIIHKEHKIYVPELIFGHLLTSANYDKNEKKITGGKNGYGAKLTNIFSKLFILETVDQESKKKYIQRFEDNMLIKHDPVIKSCNNAPYTKITFKPDLERFGLESMSDDIYGLMVKRVYDICACTNVNVYLNDKRINCNGLLNYVNYYFDEKIEKVHEYIDERWEVVVIVGDYDQISFVNGVNTIKGGKHVDHVIGTITRKLVNVVKTKGYKRKKLVLKQSVIKDNMIVFVRSVIENPAFDSQIKEFLTTPVAKFGSKFDVSDKFIDKLMKTSLIERAIALSNFKDNIGVEKTVNKKTNILKGIEKLDDANYAGTKNSSKCTLILTEGDSAKALAVAGVSKIGRDYFGIFPLRGKLINTRDITVKRANDNKEINSLMKILGLTFPGKKQIGLEELLSKMRYGRVMIFTDQDVDGSHIKGLVMNFFHTYWPQLLEHKGFIITLMTPIIKAKCNKEELCFYTLSEYEEWNKTKNGKYSIKYYKGLGTSTSQEAKEYFENFEEKKIEYYAIEDENDSDGNLINLNDQSFKLAFDKEYSNSRKEWLQNYDKDEILQQTQKDVSYYEYINKELIHFSNYDNERSIPNLCDGLKISQRKILYSVFKKNQKQPIKVSQLAGYVSEQSAYHHGEQSLLECIIGMAQNFVGSNNIELLYPDGQFGSRLAGGKDAASPRYIWTYMTDLTQALFHNDDNDILMYNYEDEQKIEPLYYLPIIPLVLVNGCEGIGTGFSTKVPCFNPLDIIYNIKLLMNDKEPIELVPWYRGFKGDVLYNDIDKNGNNSYILKGKWRKLDTNTIEIFELPIGTWTDNYKSYLETLIYDKTAEEKIRSKQCIISFENLCTEATVLFRIKMRDEDLNQLLVNDELDKRFKLIESKCTSMTNMHLYNSDCIIQKYDNPNSILKEFYDIRLQFYIKRKKHKLNKLEQQLLILNAKVRFINDFINKKIHIINEEDDIIYEQLTELEYPLIEESFDYLLTMPIRSLTKKRMDELNNTFDNKQTELNILKDKSEKDLWNEDLTRLEQIYQQSLIHFEETYFNDIQENKPKTKKTTKTIKKVVKKSNK